MTSSISSLAPQVTGLASTTQLQPTAVVTSIAMATTMHINTPAYVTSSIRISTTVVETSSDWFTSVPTMTTMKSNTPPSATKSDHISSTTAETRVTDTITTMTSVSPTPSPLVSTTTSTVGVTSTTTTTTNAYTSSFHVPTTTAETPSGENRNEEPMEAEGAIVFGMAYIVVIAVIGVGIVISDITKLITDIKIGLRNMRSSMCKRN